MLIFIFGIRSKKLKCYSKGVWIIISTSIISNFPKYKQQKLIVRTVNSLNIRTEQEISKVLGRLGNSLVDRFKQSMVDKVLLIHNIIHPKTKYFRVKKLVPLLIYVFLTLREFKVNKSDLIQVSKIFYEEFNCFFHPLKDLLLKHYQCGNYV